MNRASIKLSTSDSQSLKQYRSTVKASLEQLAGLEQRARAPRPTHLLQLIRRVPRVPSHPSDCSLCTTCGTPGCHYTECPQGNYVFDTHAVARPLACGESLPLPASWRDLHRATLQGTLRVIGQYYRHLHTSPRHLEQARLIVARSLGFSDNCSTPVPSAPATKTLLLQAVRAVTARLRADPLTASISGLFNSLCECYHSPVFDVTLDQFRQSVLEQASVTKTVPCPSPP